MSIRDRRRQLGITQQELADRSGVTQQAIHYLEQGRFWPSMPTAKKIAGVLDLSMDALHAALRQSREEA